MSQPHQSKNTNAFFLQAGVSFAVALLTIQAFVINRAAGLDYPVWARRKPADAAPPATPGGRPASA